MSLAATAPTSGLSYQMKVRLLRYGLVTIALAVWELLSRGVDHPQVPPPSLIAAAFVSILQDPGLLKALGGTLLELAAAFALSVVIGGVLGYLIAMGPRVERIGMPILLLIYGIPQVTILPLFILYFGLGAGSKIAFGVSHGLFPIALGLAAGLKRAKPIYALWAHSLGARFKLRILRVQLPQAIPALCTGMRLAMSMTLLGVLLAELYVSSFGVGFYVRAFTNSSQGPKLFALIFALAFIAVALNGIVSRIEKLAGAVER